MTDQKNFKVEKDGHIAWLTMNRPEKRNSMGRSYFEELTENFKEFDADDNVRVVVIKAEGKSFTSGLDLVEAAEGFTGTGADSRETIRKLVLQGQESLNLIEKCTKPVIVAAHSHCIGGGVDLLSACDIRMASKDAVFSIRETRIAIIADLGTLQRLPYIIGHGWFRELALTGRDFTAEEALKMGFITRIAEDKDALIKEAEKLASEIAGLAPLAVQGTKDTIMYSRDNGIYPGLQYVAQKNAVFLLSEDLGEAMAAFLEKREPIYKGK